MQNLWVNLVRGWHSPIQLLGVFGLSAPIKDPVAVFLIIMAIMLVAPIMFERLRLPGIVGLIIAGVIVGPNGLGLLARDSTIILLGTVGLLFLMFMAGLETSIDDLKLNANKAIIFGLATFIIPMVLGTGAMLLLGYNFLAAILVASCFASHTLLALPVATKLGIMRTQAVTVTLGGTLITNILALLVLAVVVKAHQGSLTLSFWLFLIPSLGIYTFATLWGVPKIGRWFFQKFGHDDGAEFIFVVATLFIVSYAAQLIEIEPIIGAFLVGIAISQLIPQLSPLMNRIQFIGNTLFVPFFLISVGMLVNPWILFKEPRSMLVSLVMVLVAIIAKFLPAWGSGKLFKFDFANIMVMFGLSVAQAASTLAAITVAFNIKLVDELTVNGTVAMILVTCIASPWITNRWGASSNNGTNSSSTNSKQEFVTVGNYKVPRYRILVPVANPNTEASILELAMILAKATDGTLLPLNIIVDNQPKISGETKIQQQHLLAAAETIAHAAVTNVEAIGRLDDSIEKGILRTAFERNANLIICGWKGFATYRDNFFGGAIDNVIRRTTIPVLITRFTHAIKTTQRVVLPIVETDLTSVTFLRTLALTRILANELKASLLLLQVSPPRKRSKDIEIPEIILDIPIQRIQGKFTNSILKILQPDDLLILTHNSDSTIPGLPSLGITTEAIARNSKEISLIVFHFPRRIPLAEDNLATLQMQA
ncbi:sodium/hydrogen exchanger [Rivularia sp. IAM M-261]|nr:sodium/hydrogen exchanger [Calothrix sp. PCC 7716]GJD15425.1 sodium/hydrogen exchanger [Rivularia sp. IAM M-261]